jgi:hypothetical protein
MSASGNTLPGLNFDSELAAEDYQTNRNFVEQAILGRFLLSMGNPPGSAPSAGIVDFTDPSIISASQISRPLLVTISTQNLLQVAITSGTAVSPSGAIISVPSTVFSLPLARTLANDVNVVFVENSIIPGGTSNLNDYNNPLTSQDVQNPTTWNVALLGDWNNVSLFSPTRKSNIVVIAIVAVVPTVSAGLQLQIDLTQNTYSYNRPWFTVQDIQHRSRIGSGEVTDENPHGTDFNNISTAGNVNLFQGTADTGLMVSRDLSRSKMVGAVYCTEQIPLNRIQEDITGLVTLNSKYGGTGASYCALLGFPTRLGSVYDSITQSNSISAEVIEGTNILVFGPNEPLPNALTAEYTETQAMLPPATAPTNLLTFGLPATGELMTAGGKTYLTVANPTVNLEGSGPFPRLYSVYLLDNGTLQIFPQILIPAIPLSVVGNALYPTSQSMAQAARIRIGLTLATPVTGMDVQITLYGKDINGNPQQEVIEFATALGYADAIPPSVDYDSLGQQAMSQNVYSVLNNIQVTNNMSAGPQATFQVWADSEPGTAPAMNDYAKVAVLGWNGQGITQIQDARVISRGFARMPRKMQGSDLLDAGRFLSALQLSPLLNHRSLELLTEDFEDLTYFDSTSGFAASVQATAVISISNNSFLHAGDTIEIAPGFNLQLISTTPNTAIGQVQIGANAGATQTNIIATVNDPTFNPGVLASVGVNTNVNLQLTRITGSLGNAVVLSAVLSNVLALSLSGYQAGYDPYGECYFDRSLRGLRSLNVPTSGNLTPSSYTYRTRYRSRATALPASQGARTTFGVEVRGEDPYRAGSLRIRGAHLDTPNQWTPWQVMTALTPGFAGFYTSTFGTAVHKVQVEYYGRAQGCSIYNLVPNS